MTAREASDYALGKGVWLSPLAVFGHAKATGVPYRYVILKKPYRQVISYDRASLIKVLDRIVKEKRGTVSD